MSGSLVLPPSTDRETLYQALLPQIFALVDGEQDLIANLANTSAALHASFQWLWVGFYLVKNDALVLGPFQGPIACTRIPFGKGVCGTAWAECTTLIVDDVNQFPGHIACSPDSRAEIVVPIIKDHACVGVLDIDSRINADFSAIDRLALETVTQRLAQCF